MGTPHKCVPIDTTDVLTPTGWVAIRDIEVGDPIAIVDPRDMHIIFSPVEKVSPIHKDTVFTTTGMTITREHNVLYNTTDGQGYRKSEYQKICDQEYFIPSAGEISNHGLDITSSEMVFLQEALRIGTRFDDDEKDIHYIEFHYIMESKIRYFEGLLINIGYKYEKRHEDLGPVVFTVTDKHALELQSRYVPNNELNWNWLQMNSTQFSYFMYKITEHVNKSWYRKYVSKSIVNIGVMQAICALNSYGTYYDKDENALYIQEPYRRVKPKTATSQDDVDVMNISVKNDYCYLIRQNGYTTITGGI